MDFIGTEVGIKIRSAIKAKLTELGKTVDDELIDYIMVMVANKKEETQMAHDLQPFLELDTVKFTSWLHKVLQKLEQVTVIVTDDEYKIATSAFSNKISKKRKSTDASGKKKSSTSKEEPKEKKKKIKHDHKHNKGSTEALNVANSSKVLSDKPLKTKHVSPQPAAGVRVVKIKRSKPTAVGADDNKKKSDESAEAEAAKPPAELTKASAASKKGGASTNNNTTKSPSAVQSAVSSLHPVMMVSDDDDDDDDFINIKTDMGEEDELLEEERVQKTPSTSKAAEEKEAVAAPPKSRAVAVLEKPAGSVPSQKLLKLALNEATQQKQTVVAVAVPSTSQPPARRLLVRTSQATSTPTPQASARTPASIVQRPPIRSRVGAVLKRKASPLADDDEEDARNGSVASVVKVTPRPKVPAASQAPKNLLLKAMAEAQRSVASMPKRSAPEPDSQRQPLFTKKFWDQQPTPDMMERIAITLPNVKDPSSAMEEDENNEEAEDAYVPKLVATPSSSLPVGVMYSPSPITKPQQSKEGVENPRSGTPEFLVTLDGYPGYSGYLEEKLDNEAHSTEEGMEENVSEKEGCENTEQKSPKPRRQKIVFTSERDTQNTDKDDGKKVVLKSLDRCRFWPACRSGDSCTFHHPTLPCKSFPNCAFGDRCIYIHPNCKFDASCTRKDCPFTHASPRNLSAVSPTIPVPAPRPMTQRLGITTCRFFPSCSNVNCRFFHPKPCRYGRLCSKPECTFIHSDIPPKDKMKWVNSVR